MLTIELSVDQLELGRLYFRVCDFDAAIKTLAASLLDAERKENWDRFAQHIPLLLRILAERLDFEEIHNLRHRLKEAPLAVWTSPLHYALGIADLYSNEVESAKGHFESARQTARNVNELAHARFGLIAVSFKQGRFSEASEILFRLRRDLAPTTLQDLKIATHLMSSHILMNQAEIEEAMVQLSLAENLCRNEHNLFMLLNTLFAQAVAQKKLKRFSRALNYLELVDSLTSRRDLKHLSIQVERELKDVRDILARPTLILIEGDGLSLEHPEKGRIPLNRSGMLIDLLKFLGSRIGEPVSKEDIVKRLWKEEYHPFQHDNKIYVTIKRLRKILEIDTTRPKYLICQSNGYFLQNGVRFTIERSGL